MITNRLDTLRTRLRDILFGRPRFHILPAPDAADLDAQPVFIIGTFRSGTTLLRYLLDSHSRIGCPPETKFMVHLAAMYTKESTMNAFNSMGFDLNYVRRRMRAFATDFYSPYLAANKKSLIVDKTPDYVRILNFLDWLYEGQGRYIMIFRNGLDTAQSMNSINVEPLEPGKTLHSAFNYWYHDTELMCQWFERYPDRCHKIVYEQLCKDVRSQVSSLLAFIGEKWEEGILKWYDKHHDRGQEDIKARRLRKISKSVNNFSHWDPKTIEEFKAKASSLHAKIGYNPNTLNPE